MGSSATVFPAASRTVSCPSVSPAYTGAATLSASPTSFVRPFASAFYTSRVFSLVSTGCTVPRTPSVTGTGGSTSSGVTVTSDQVEKP